MDEIVLITKRRQEVEAAIVRMRNEIAGLENELAELDVAGRVMARLSGADWPPAGAANERATAPVAIQQKRPGMSLPQMIRLTLERGDRRGLRGMEPKDIRQAITDELGHEVKSEAVSSICWRMWKRGDLIKDEGSPLYHLAEKEKPVDEAPGQDSPTGLFSNPKHGREAGQGGGT